MTGPLAGVRVVDLAGEPGVFASRVLADLGADVVRVEPPGGGSLRALGPFLEGAPGVERGFPHLFFNANKRSVAGDDDTIRGLARAADVLVETERPGRMAERGLGYADLSAANPALVYLSVTPFGQDGPYAQRAATDLTASAAGGLLWVCGSPDGPPTQPGADQSWKMAGLVGAAGTIAALYGRDHDDARRGCHIDVSVQECVAFTVLQTSNPNQYTWFGRVPKRPGLTAVYRTADGAYVTAYPSRNRIGTLLEWARSVGVEVVDSQREIESDADLALRTAGIFRAIALKVSAADWMREVVERDIWSLPVHRLPDMRSCEHLIQTKQFVEVPHEPLGVTLEMPRSPVDACVPDLDIRRAPLLGEHGGDVRWATPAATAGPTEQPRKRPLEGIRILDFCWVLAGPLGTRVLANLGAEVIRVEAAPDRWFPDVQPPGHERELEMGAFHNNVNTGKRSVTIDPRKPGGRELLLRLAEQCDVVTDNYRPGTLDELGLGYEELRVRNPKIVVAHLPGCGSSGPWASRPTLGNMIVAASGISALTGFPGHSPRGMGVAYPDFSSPYVLAACVAAALRERDRTDAGAELDISQLSATISLIGAEWMQYAATGREPPPRANRDHNHAPHGTYPSAGDDQWIAIAVAGDDQWAAFRGATGLPEDVRFATHTDRKANEDELDAAIASWTSTRDKWEAADLLQDAGIAASAVIDLSDALERDPHLAKHYHRVRRPEAPDVEIVVHGEPIRFRGAEWPLQQAPGVGADNGYVLLDLLGLSGKQLGQLYEDRAII